MLLTVPLELETVPDLGTTYLSLLLPWVPATVPAEFHDEVHLPGLRTVVETPMAGPQSAPAGLRSTSASFTFHGTVRRTGGTPVQPLDDKDAVAARG
jgi:hypothetical protein